ncbi:helix-turn-helix domain-containing protein [Streptomyces avermitilis]|uniref:helix-turn-helix domain-containing protein n=1 Tax=Streptomyces avermitilis TaxID=33903 RepID=UPI00382F6D69
MHHVRRFLYHSGGVRLVPHQRSERHLTGGEREEISRGIAAGESARQLARRLGRSAQPSRTVPRDRSAPPATTGSRSPFGNAAAVDKYGA